MSSKVVKSNRLPKEVTKKPRKRRARVSKGKSEKKLRQKQKQKQIVNVQVSAGGSGGGGYIPMPAPAPDYMALANLLRPAAVANVPIREAPVAGALPAREAEAPPLRNVAEVAAAVARERERGREIAQREREREAARLRAIHEADIRDRAIHERMRAVLPPPPRVEPVGERMAPMSESSSEAESSVAFREARPIAHHKRKGTIPSVGGFGSGKKTVFEEDIYGRSMPIGGGAYNPEKEKSTRSVVKKKKGVVSYLDLPSTGETEDESISKIGGGVRFM